MKVSMLFFARFVSTFFKKNGIAMLVGFLFGIAAVLILAHSVDQDELNERQMRAYKKEMQEARAKAYLDEWHSQPSTPSPVPIRL